MKNMQKWVLIIAAAFFVFGGTACQQAAEKQQEKAIENVLEHASGEDVKADVEKGKVAIESESGKTTIDMQQKKWPADAPSDVPEFRFGRIEAVVVSEAVDSKTWSVHYKEVPDEAFDQYVEMLKNAGFTNTMKMKAPKGSTLTGEKGQMVITFVVSEGIAHVGIQVRSSE